MKFRFWGVRGSIPTPGSATARYGGNTSCLQVSAGNHTLVFDCGTGARWLGQELVGRPNIRVDVLFTHLHADHVFGFPFFAPIYAPSHEISVTVPAEDDEKARRHMNRYLNGVNHPVRIREIPSRLQFRGVTAGQEIERGEFQIRTCRLNHPGGALAYRIEQGGRALVYVTDTAPLARPGEGIAAGAKPPEIERRVVELMEGADDVVFDTMFEWEEYLEKMTWGHSYPEYAVALAEAAGARRLHLFHHSPDTSDDQLDALSEKWAVYEGLDVRVAREGEDMDLEG